MKKVYYIILAALILTLTGCNKQKFNKITHYTGVVVEESTRTPIPNVKVSVTNGNRVHCATVTNEQGVFELTVDFNQITTDYYLFLDGTPDLPVNTETLRGIAQTDYDYREIVLYNMNTPEVTTAEPTDVFVKTVKLGGTVTDDKGQVITERGVCWGTGHYPNINGEHAKEGTGLGVFSIDIDGLEKQTTYYVRAYAINGAGVGYGEEMSFTTMAAESGLFSVSDTKKVRFALGNLQYQASTNTWSFAEHPWDFVGGPNDGNVYENGVKCDNELIDSLYAGWIDLFAWGTSGYNHGAVYYQPWSTSNSGYDYKAYGNQALSLYDLSGKADWGYNAISNGGNQENMWRTLTYDEWWYLLDRRPHPSNVFWYCAACVNGVQGLVVLPDDWDFSIYPLYFDKYQYYTANFEAYCSKNNISANDWTDILEANGAVFLPQTGMRKVNEFFAQSTGADYRCKLNYWSSANYYYNSGASAYLLSNYRYPDGVNKGIGYPVRLVRDAE